MSESGLFNCRCGKPVSIEDLECTFCGLQSPYENMYNVHIQITVNQMVQNHNQNIYNEWVAIRINGTYGY